MMIELGKGLEATTLELAKTQTMIRQYNKASGKRLTSANNYWLRVPAQTGGRGICGGYLVGGIGILFAILSRLS